MKYIKTTTIALASTLLLAQGCFKTTSDCSELGNCDDSSAGSTSGGSSSNGGSSGGGASATNACDNACKGSTPVCNETTAKCVGCLATDDCSSSEPVCDTSTSTCVQCLKNANCSSAAKPVCDTAEKVCVGCMATTDCTKPTESVCDTATNTCTTCKADADCAHVSGKTTCSVGTCVECTVENEAACGANSCNAATKTCTATPRGSVDLCGACVADSECTNGVGTITARCVPMTFKGAPHGNYCLEAVSSGCDKPFGSTQVVTVTAASVSGAASESYCGINQEFVTCEAVRDMKDVGDTIRCTNSLGQKNDALCGCHRDAAGVCTDAGVGGLCRTINGADRCTVQCSDGAECKANNICVTASPLYCG